jgi:hypothetical protein
MPVLTTESQARKAIPLATGVLDYFPAALAAVAGLSVAGNEKHNPGQPLHWSRGKSNDHADTILRHLADRGEIDPEDGIRHSVKVAWRALALLQEELEREEGVTPGRASVFEKEEDRQPRSFIDLAEPDDVPMRVVDGIELGRIRAMNEPLDWSPGEAPPDNSLWVRLPKEENLGHVGNDVGNIRLANGWWYRRTA